MNKKILSLCIASAMLLSALPTTVFAASVGSTDTDKSVGSDSVQNQQTQYANFHESDAETEVYLTVDDSELLVSVPSTLILSGTPTETGEYIAKYSVSVKGDMSGDKTVTIEPESDTVLLNQVGKDSKSANIYQNQTDFDTDDFKNETVTNGSVVAQSLTAGSWNGEVDFLINVNKMSHYYSTLALALDDINNSTIYTENSTADLTNASNAACSVYKSGSTYRIEILKDLTDLPMLNINQDTKLDLNNHTINFADGQYLSSDYNLSIYNGALRGNNSNYILSIGSENNNKTLNLSNLEIELNADSSYNLATYAVLSKAGYNNINNLRVSMNNEATSIGGIFINNTSSVNNLNKVNLDLRGNLQVVGLQLAGNSKLNNSDLSTLTNNINGTSYTINIPASSTTNIKNSKIEANNNGSSSSSVVTLKSVGVLIKSGSNVIIDNVDSFASGLRCGSTAIYNVGNTTILSGKFVNDEGNISGDARGAAITNNTGGVMTLKEETGTIFVSGMNNGIGHVGSKLNIYGGTYQSPNHGGLYNISSTSSSVINIYGGTFKNVPYSGNLPNVNVTSYGGIYSSGTGTINIENANIIGGNHGIRIKDNKNVKINIKNSYIEGRLYALSLASGTLTLNEGVITKYTTDEFQMEGGTLVDNRS